ncbi:MAG TPA: OmpH family outer membrane protein [Fuerstia sp.]|nr:OmpH family outer membrane protein [Fuerstiella sp.]
MDWGCIWQRSALTVKQLILTLLAVAITATTGAVQAQSPAPPTKGHRVGLIDMAHVFQHYKKFEELRSGLQAEIEKSDAEAKVMVERLQKGQAEIKKFDSGSPEYEQREKQLLDLKGEFDAFRAATQRRLARRESETFKVIYTDVTKAVKLYAEYAHFDHVMRFNRKGIEEITNPQEAVQTMNKTFIYTNSENDITDVVLQYLNKPYASGAPAPNTAKGNVVPAGRTRQQ